MLKRYKDYPVQVKASLWFLLCSFFQKGISVITTPIFTRLLTPDEYGQYSVFTSWLSIITVFVTLQISLGVYTQGLVKFSDDKYVFSSSLQGLNLTLVLIWAGIYFPFHSFWNSLTHLTTTQMISMLLLMWATAVYNFWAAEQRVQYNYKALVLLTIAISIVKPLVSIIAIMLSNAKVNAWVLSMALVEVIFFISLFFIQLSKGKIFFSKKYWLYALGFNLPLVPHYLSQQVLNGADRIMIQNLSGESEAGIYGLAYSISLVMTLFNIALMQTLSPWIYQKIKCQRINEIGSVATISLVIIAIVNIILISFAPEAVALFAPASYHDAIWIVPPVAMSVVFMYSYDLFAKFEFYYEKTGFIMIASVAGALLNVLLNYIFINRFGYFAAAYTTLICYIIYSFSHYTFMKIIIKKYCNDIEVYSTKTLLLIYSIFLVLGFIIMSTYNYPAIRYIFILVLMIIIIIKRKYIGSVLKTMVDLKRLEN